MPGKHSGEHVPTVEGMVIECPSSGGGALKLRCAHTAKTFSVTSPKVAGRGPRTPHLASHGQASVVVWNGWRDAFATETAADMNGFDGGHAACCMLTAWPALWASRDLNCLCGNKTPHCRPYPQFRSSAL